MNDFRQPPWTGMTLAAAGGIGMVAAGVEFWIAIAVTVLWIGSLWIALPPPEQFSSRNIDSMNLSHEGLKELIEHSGLPLLMLDKNRILIANKGAREVLGSHILGQDARVAFRHPAAVELLGREGSGSATIQGLSGARSIWQMNRHPVDDRYTMIELVNRTVEADISRAHTDFVANASHELRTPLASIIGYVETLVDDEEGLVAPETRQKFLGTVLREAKRLQSLVDDLMSLSRVEAEKHDQPREKLEMAAILNQAARDAAGSERIKRLQFEMPQEQVWIRGDRQQMEQLVRNLVDNALKYGAATEPVTVSLQLNERDMAVVTVRDRGEGIAAEHLPHLTRRFYRTDPGRSRAAGGTGLGLAIVKHIVERHRGRMDITSKQGEGTNVTVILPTLGQSEE